jgi:hypothetical protein
LIPKPSQAVASTVSSVAGLIVYFLFVTDTNEFRLPDLPQTTHPAWYHDAALVGVVHNNSVEVKDLASKDEIAGSEGAAAHAPLLTHSASVNSVSNFFIMFVF